MSAEIRKIFPGPSVRSDVAQAVMDMELGLMGVIGAAKGAGVPQGLVCAILRVHEQMQVNALIEGAE